MSQDTSPSLFSGRLPRVAFILGSLVVAFITISIVLIVFPIIAKFSPLAILILFVVFLLVNAFYGFSLGLRRLHDLNRNGFWLIIYLPSFLFSLWSFTGGFSLGFLGETSPVTNMIFQTLSYVPDSVLSVLKYSRFLTILLSLYVLFWPGDKGANSYALPLQNWKLHQILGFK